MNDKVGPEREEEKPEVKVVDRRAFTSDGRRREEPAAGPGSAPAAEPGPAKSGSAGGGEAPRPQPDGPVRGEGFTMDGLSDAPDSVASRDAAFLNLCVSLYESGFIHLGTEPGQGEAAPEIDLDAARGAVEMLEMLRRKTAGNLTKEERQILDSLLAELKMAYVMKVPGS
jgi:hypothetical protein